MQNFDLKGGIIKLLKLTGVIIGAILFIIISVSMGLSPKGAVSVSGMFLVAFLYDFFTKEIPAEHKHPQPNTCIRIKKSRGKIFKEYIKKFFTKKQYVYTLIFVGVLTYFLYVLVDNKNFERWCYREIDGGSGSSYILTEKSGHKEFFKQHEEALSYCLKIMKKDYYIYKERQKGLEKYRLLR